MQSIEVKGSVRIDLTGGTLDLFPIPLVIPNAKTINFATSLCAEVKIRKLKSHKDQVKIISLDFSSEITLNYSDILKRDKNELGDFYFIGLICSSFLKSGGVEITLRSDSPVGAGLGGSSSLGATLGKALCEYQNISMSREEIISRVRRLESLVLGQGIPGYQDYYPALHGGVLSLSSNESGVELEQVFSKDLKEILETELTLVYSGKTRNSGINNWAVYKSFFDGEEETVKGLSDIAKASEELYLAIKNKEFSNVTKIVANEGRLREKLFPSIFPEEIKDQLDIVSKIQGVHGLKVCGAGGGGCFLICHEKNSLETVVKELKKTSFKVLPFEVLGPISQ